MAKYVIEGKLFDTDDAELVHDWENGEAYGDLNYLNETLYCTPQKSFFVVGDGGARTLYAQPNGANSFTGGTGAAVLTADEALEWLQNHDADADTILQYFELPVG